MGPPMRERTPDRERIAATSKWSPRGDRKGKEMERRLHVDVPIFNSGPSIHRMWADLTPRGERLEATFYAMHNYHSRYDPPHIWAKEGCTARELDTWWKVDVYATDRDGNCWGRYDPTAKRDPGHKGAVIDFDWIMEATPENLEKISREIERRAFPDLEKAPNE